MLSARQAGFPVLSLLVLLPVVIGALVATRRAERAAYRLAIAGAAVELALSVLVVLRLEPDTAALQLVERVPLALGVSYHLGVDGISALFIPLCALLTLLVALYAQQATKADPQRYLLIMFCIEATVMGALTALDLLLFWLFIALEIAPVTALIRRWGVGAQRRLAQRRYLVFSLMSAALVLAGMVLLARGAAGAAGAPLSFDLLDVAAAPALPPRDQALAFFLLFFGLAIRVPLFPFHGWLPLVLENGPVVGVSVFLVGVKVGAYGFLRFVIPLLPEAAAQWAWLVILLGVVGTLHGALLALVQVTLTRLVAYACLSHMGSVMVGLFVLSFEGLAGGLGTMLNLGVAAAGLTFIAGFLHARLGSSRLGRVAGLSQQVPLITLTYLVIALTTIGMPLTSGFSAGHQVLEATLEGEQWTMAVATAFGGLFAAAYLLRYYQQAFLAVSPAPAAPSSSPTSGRAPAPDRVPDLRLRELIIAGSLGGLVLGFGIFGSPLSRIMDGSLRALAARVEQRTHPGRGAAPHHLSPETPGHGAAHPAAEPPAR